MKTTYQICSHICTILFCLQRRGHGPVYAGYSLSASDSATSLNCSCLWLLRARSRSRILQLAQSYDLLPHMYRPVMALGPDRYHQRTVHIQSCYNLHLLLVSLSFLLVRHQSTLSGTPVRNLLFPRELT